MILLVAPLLLTFSGAAPSAAPAAPPAAALPVLALDLEAVNVAPDTARAVNRLVVAALGELTGLHVTSQEDMRTLANLDASRQALDCNAQSCLAEVAGALGASAVVFGSVTGLGSTTSITLSLFDSKTGLIKRRALETKNLDEVPAALRPALRELFVEAGLMTVEVPPPPPSPWVYAGIGTAAVGALALVGGVVTTTVCELQLQSATMPGAEKEPLQQAGQVGLVVAVVGALAGAAGTVMLMLPEGT